MAKLCKHNECERPVFSKGYCSSHQYLREDKKQASSKEIKSKPIALPLLLELAQKAHNTYVRMRDQNKGCISCTKGKVEHAGHYFPVGSYSGVRFNEINVNGQDYKCNVGEYGNLNNYWYGLIERYGVDKANGLREEAARTKFYKWTREELEEIINDRKERIRQLTCSTDCIRR